MLVYQRVDVIVCCHLHLADSISIGGRLDHREPLFEGQGFGMGVGGFESVESVEASCWQIHHQASIFMISMKQFPSKIRPKLYIPEKSSIENTLNCDAFKHWILSFWNTYFLEAMLNLRGVTDGVSLRGVRQPAVSGRIFVTERY